MRIAFSPYSTGGGIYSTNDNEVIQALDAHQFNGRKYRKLEEQKKETIRLKAIPGITRCADARDYLAQQGYQGYLASKSDIVEAARSMGIEFTEL